METIPAGLPGVAAGRADHNHEAGLYPHHLRGRGHGGHLYSSFVDVSPSFGGSGTTF